MTQRFYRRLRRLQQYWNRCEPDGTAEVRREQKFETKNRTHTTRCDDSDA